MTLRKIFLACVLLGLAGCAAPAPQATNVNGGLQLLGDGVPGLHANANMHQWWDQRSSGQAPVMPVNLQGTVALRADTQGGAVLGRRLNTTLGATPYLRWSWYLEPTAFAGGTAGGQERGLRISVFFKAPQRSLMQRYSPMNMFSSSEWDGAVDIVFGGYGAARIEEATQGKWLIDSAGQRRELRPPRTAQTGVWHAEMIDLGEVYRLMWPNQPIENVQVMMIAAGSLPAKTPPDAGPVIGYIAEISISR